MKEQALKKLLDEMLKGEANTVMERLHVWLCNSDDEELLTAVCKEDRTLCDASMYCYKKGSELTVKNGSMGVADVTDEMEQEFATEYFLAAKVNKKDLMKWPVPKGETKTVTVERKVEVIKEVYVDTPNAEHIREYLDQQKAKQKESKKVSRDEGSLSLFDV